MAYRYNHILIRYGELSLKKEKTVTTLLRRFMTMFVKL